ncbi:MAG: Biotin carboxyl carrier protein of acetyl-CoA carboxylase [Holosporales bacterium]
MELKINHSAVKELAEILKETGLTEIEYETEHGRIRVAKSLHVEQSVAVQPVQQSVASPTPVVPQADPAIHPGTVRSPMVGTVYLSPEPGAPTFVTVGANVTEGQTLLIIESMKVMNPIKAKKAGCIKQIFVSDATPVEFNEPLLIIE